MNPPPFHIAEFNWNWRQWLARLVDVQRWQEVGSFLNGWANAGSPWANAGYYRDTFDLVRLRGRITGGTSGAAAFTLPEGYRPPVQMAFACDGGSVTLDTSGNVIVTGTAVSLENIHYRVST